ncbi:MAG TPA: ABC transporter substrate-binding protein, partial [Stellaceae bacterium]|nr:ABC transporter substrate-binding protein [Stellaceae bacterium]
MPRVQTRRRFLATTASAGAAAILSPRRTRAAAPTLETTAVRFEKSAALCVAPQYIVEEVLRADGFTDIRYIEGSPPGVTERVANGTVDFQTNYAPNLVTAIDRGESITMLTGVMVGCYELFGNEDTRSITDLKGKTVGMQALGSIGRILVTLMAAHVGLDPAKDIHWVTDPKVKPKDLFIDGKIDAFLGFSPEPQELRARRIGHVIVNSAVDRPWSQYLCCMLAANPEYVRNYPVATKCVVRAILKATDFCAAEPARAAQRLVDGGFTPRYDYALQTLKENAYDKWRDYDAEDTIRFYALRMHEAGFIKSTPQKIIAENTD